MANTLVLLEKVTVGAAGASSITFSNIPQTGYNDLVIKMSIKTASANRSDAVVIKPNGLTTNGTAKRLYGNGASATSDSLSVVDGGQADGNSSGVTSTWSNGEIYIPNYASSNYKSMSVDAVSEGNETTAYAELGATLWSATAAITSLNISCTSNLLQYSTFFLYGVSNVNTTPLVAPKATGGDIIQTDGTYWYHAFLSSGSFTPATNLTCDLLVAAGGGGGGASGGGGDGGGGGAGGLLSFTSQAITGISVVTVGTGGAGGTSAGGTVGNDSQFASLTLVKGGGYGASRASKNGGNGGSGGGGAYSSGTGGTATSGQGQNGGAGSPTQGASGGGGGAVGTGVTPSNQGGNGGAGSSVYSSWYSLVGIGQNVSGTYYTNGGGGGADNGGYGGGAGGNGGGGASSTGVTTGNGTNGTANTGGGGGGAVNGTSGNGGSGFVIVRYTVA